MSIKAIKYKETCPNCHRDYLIRYSPYASGCMACLTNYLADHMIYQYDDLENYIVDDFHKESQKFASYNASRFTQIGNQKFSQAIYEVAVANQFKYLSDELKRVKEEEELLPIDDLMIQHVNRFLAGYESVNYEMIRQQLISSLLHDHDEDCQAVNISQLDVGLKEYHMAIYEHLMWMAMDPTYERFYTLLCAYLRLLEAEVAFRHSEFYDDYEQFENVYHYYADEFESNDSLYLKSLAYTYRGMMLELRGLYEDALSWYEKACKIINRFKDTTQRDERALRKYFCHMAHLYEAIDDYEEANAFYLMAIDLLKELPSIELDNDQLSAMATMEGRVAWLNDIQGSMDDASVHYATGLGHLKTSTLYYPDVRTLRGYVDIVMQYAESLEDQYVVPFTIDIYELLEEGYSYILKNRHYFLYRYNYCVTLYKLTGLYKSQTHDHYEEYQKKTIEAVNDLIKDYPEMKPIINYIQDEAF